VKSPYNEGGGYTVEELLCQDPWHTQNIILHPRDRNGNLVLSDKPTPETQSESLEDHVKKAFEKFDLPAWQVQKLLREWLQTAADLRKQMMTNCTVTGV
jgi:hypothetical protein